MTKAAQTPTTRIPVITEGLWALARDPAEWPRTNLWYHDASFELYARSTQRLVRTLGRVVRTLDLANFSVTDTAMLRQGLMRDVFDVAEAVVRQHAMAEAVFVESVLNPQALVPFLQARGYGLAAPTEFEGATSNWVKLIKATD